MRFPVVIRFGVLALVVIGVALTWARYRGGGEGIRFTDVGASAGIDLAPETRAEGAFRLIESSGSGIAVIDYDGDGWMDLVIGRGGELPGDRDPLDNACRLYRNRGDGTFEDVTERAGLRFAPFAQGMAVGDFDADGHPDLFIAGFERSALFRNTGRGGFEDVTETAGVAGEGWASSCAFADLDGDGYLDLYVTRYLGGTVDHLGRPTVRCPTATQGMGERYGYCPPHAHTALSDLVYRNNGDGTFTDVSEASGIGEETSPGLAVAILDVDNDGLLDIYVANDMRPNHWWRNLGDFRFQESAKPAGLAYGQGGESHAGMGVAVGDYDGDGMIDLMVTNFQDEPNDLYRQVAPGVFTLGTEEAGLKRPSRRVLGFGIAFLDADNSGHLDLVVANGHLNDFRSDGTPYQQAPQLFRNVGGGRFVDFSDEAGRYFRTKTLARAVALADFDNDGDIDIVVTHLDRPPALLRNDSRPRGHFLGLELAGDSPSGTAIGAVIRVACGDRVSSHTLYAGGSYLTSSDPRLLVGLGEHERVDRLTIRWPGGAEQTFEGLDADHYYRIVEGGSPEKR